MKRLILSVLLLAMLLTATAMAETPAPKLPETETRYACTRADVSGAVIDPSTQGGEYAVVFHADGSATLTLAGAVCEGLTWREETGAFVIDYYNAGYLRFVAVADGCTLNYKGEMVLYFSAE